MNDVTLMGRLTRDPEARYSTVNGEDVCFCRFTLAVDRRVAKGKDKEADFIFCEAVGKLGEVCEKHLAQGKQICVNGAIRTGSFKKEGKTQYTWAVRIKSMEFCGKKDDDEGKGRKKSEKKSDKWASIDEMDLEGLPFE